MMALNPPHSATERLGAFVAASHWEGIPVPMRHEAKRSLLNFLGCTLGVAGSEPVAQILRVLTPLSGAHRVTVLGRAERLDPLNAAFVNAAAANLIAFDDTHLETVIHPTAPVAPAVLALAEQHRLSGADLLHAFILGVEVECRIGMAVSPAHYDRGWHITSTCGVFGSAAASARLLGLDAARTAHALGIAASQSAGLVQNLPAGAKNVGVGNAARNGMFAALLAQQGYTAAAGALDGPLGWARAMGDELTADAVSMGLGQTWELARNSYKPYSCGIVMHALIDACLDLRRGLDLADIAEVTVSGDQLLQDRGDRAATNEREARVSNYHCAAVALLFGAAGQKEFAQETVDDPAVAALRARTHMRVDPTVPRGAARVTIRTVGGQVFEQTVTHARGSAERPLSDQDIEDKVRGLANWAGFKGDIGAAIAQVWALDMAAGLAPLLAALNV